jgi:hypothetical protein
VAGLTAANVLAGNPLTKPELVTEATKIEGHPDNVAPAILGGITVNVMEDGRVESLKIALARPLKLVVLVPDMPLPTSKARAALPRTVPHKDAVYNASRAALLVGSLMSGDYEFLTTALEDRLHQPYRLPLIPGGEGSTGSCPESRCLQRHHLRGRFHADGLCAGGRRRPEGGQSHGRAVQKTEYRDHHPSAGHRQRRSEGDVRKGSAEAPPFRCHTNLFLRIFIVQ